VTSICKPCCSERGKQWNKANPERAKANRDAYRLANRDAAIARSAAWRAANAEKERIRSAAWSANNSDRKRAATAKRRAALLRAIPSWASMEDIHSFYRLAARLTRETGIKAHVDHVVPLQSPLVCGLHCAANMTILPESLNKRKGNHRWPDMP